MKNHTNSTLFVLAIVMMVNALSYGTIIPLMYPYASRFGIDPLGLSILFASFSLAQFISTPILGRLSDRYGRKPLLLMCLFGSGVSLAMFAAATSVPLLFIARIIDGITGGNMSIAQAIIADSTPEKDRAKAFGLLGASFGFGFLLGPLMGGFLSTISLTAPFWFSAGLAFFGTATGIVFLKESLKEKNRESPKHALFNFSHIAHALFAPTTGLILAISFLTATAQNAWYIGFQTFTVDRLALSPQTIGIIFACFGVITILMQAGGIRYLLQRFSDKRTILLAALTCSICTTLVMAWTQTFLPFFIIVMLYGLLSSPLNPVITGLLSERTRPEDQGGILGINQSYLSLGQIVGPLTAGIITKGSLHAVFVATGAIFLMAMIAAYQLSPKAVKTVDL